MAEDAVSKTIGEVIAQLNRLGGDDPQVAAALVALARGEKPPKRYKKQYTPPVELQLNGIPTTIVDPHNEALYYWAKALREQHTPQPALLVHVDDHSDLYSANMSMTDVVGPGTNLIDAPLDQVWRFSQHLNIAAFIEPAVADGILLPTVFWHQPYTKTMKRYHYYPASEKAIPFIFFF